MFSRERGILALLLCLCVCHFNSLRLLPPQLLQQQQQQPLTRSHRNDKYSSSCSSPLKMVLSDFHQQKSFSSNDPNSMHIHGRTLSQNDDSPVVIGVAGGSGGGKTTLVNAIVDKLGSTDITCISHDSYYKDLNHLPIDERALTNFDHPSSLDTELLIRHIEQLKRGQQVEIPTYDFTTHSRTSDINLAYPKRIIIIDGILIFSVEKLMELMDLKIFVDCEDDIRLLRRIRRDTTERARSVESVIAQYESCVKPMYTQFVEPTRRKADVIMPTGNGIRRAALDLVISHMKELINVSSGEESSIESNSNMNSGLEKASDWGYFQ